MTRTLQGQIVEVLIGEWPLLATLGEKQASPDGAYLVSTPVSRVSVTLDGFAGDRHAGLTRRADGRTPFYPRGTLIRNSRQVSLVAIEELAALAAALGVPQIAPAWLGANLAVSGIPHLSRLPPGSRLFFPHEATLVIAAENLPCVYPGKALQARFPLVPGLVARFPRCARGLRGLVAWVERPGAIAAGDAVRVAIAASLPDAAGR